MTMLVGLVGLTPARDIVQQAILLGPDSLFPASAAHAMTVVRHGRTVVVPVQLGLIRENLSFGSTALGGRPEQYSIYLPPGYADRANQTHRYPVVYLLHGAPGQPSDWIHGLHVQVIEDLAVASGTLHPMIFVMPEGNGGVWHDSQYVNTHGGFHAEDLIAHDVVQYVDAHYRTIPLPGARAIVGISEGGYGAMNLGLKHRTTFGIIVSISGYYAATPGEVLFGNDPWGQDAALMATNSPTQYVHRLTGLQHVHILLMDSIGDGGYTQAARQFSRLLSSCHVRHTLLLQPAPNPFATHYWPYWRAAMPEALTFISRHVMV